ncbi:MAG: 2-isopropylmalate synthase [Pelotomaculum sp. PtaB.Bin104]|nr:MAG: 2-isopropylmalate synthase [Pelotomaculum sp. PtaB.Bin104]
MRQRKITVVDTTLRDGEQTAGVVFANREKVRIAKFLDELGVQQIEAGIPVMGGDEKEAITAICRAGLKASIMGWNRPVIKDIEASIDCGVDAVAISISTSDIHIKHKLKTTREWVLEQMVNATRFAKKEGMEISVNAEDASRSDINFLIEYARAAKEAGADRLRYCDTVGIMEPFTIYDRIKTIKDTVDIDIEMHTHDDFGMATANTLAYEAFTPEEVGLERQIVIGKHSGTASLRAKFVEYGIALTEHQAMELLPSIRSHAVSMKRPLFDKELVYVYEDYFGKRD